MALIKFPLRLLLIAQAAAVPAATELTAPQWVFVLQSLATISVALASILKTRQRGKSKRRKVVNLK